MATRKTAAAQPFKLDYGQVMDEVAKKFHMTSGSMQRKPVIESTVPTGMLSTDLILGGGIVGGRWYTAVGGEGAGKTTFKTHVEMAAASHNVPILMDADYEGCFVEDTNIMVDGVPVLFSDLLREFEVIKTMEGDRPVAVQRNKAQLFVDSYNERKVPATFKYGGNRRTTTLHLANGLTFEGAAHPIMASVLGNTIEDLWFGWCMLEQLKPGSYVLVQVGTKTPAGIVEPLPHTFRTIGSLRTINGKDYVPIRIARITKSLPKDVWDVTLASNAVPLHGAIITNGILTHNSNDPKYCEGMIEFWGNTLKTLEDMFGVIDDKGKAIVEPKVRYMTLDTAEEFFDGASSLLRRLPDKVYVEGKWWYAWDDSKVARQQSKGQHSAVMYSRYKRLMVEAENGTPQGMFFIDSYPMMFPNNLNEDDKGSGMAAVARAMSANVPKVFSKLRKKNFSIVGVNQLRQKPAVMYGSPFYEPGGDTLKYASSCRIWLTPRSVPHGKGQIEKERSVLDPGAEDTYRYIHMRTVKNKTFTPYLETWQRIWVDDGSGFAHGFDPVWDTYQFLLETGQLGPNSSLKRGLTLPTLLPDLKKPIAWLDFKGLILLNGKDLKELCAKLGIKTNPKIRERCRKQLEDRTAFTKYFDTIANRGKGGDDDEDEE